MSFVTVHGHQAAQAAMDEQQVDDDLLAADHLTVLVADVGKCSAKFRQETAQVQYQCPPCTNAQCSTTKPKK